MSGVYVVHLDAVLVSTAKTLIQLKAGAARPLEIVSASIAQGVSEVSTQEGIVLVRKTAAATVSSATPIKLNPADPDAAAVGGASATGTNASAEGTDGDLLVDDAWNILSGWVYYPAPDARIWVPGGGMIGLKLPVAPAAALTLRASVVFREHG